MTGAEEPQQVLIGHLWTWKTRYLEEQANFNEINRKYFKIQSTGTTITIHQFHEDVILNEKKLVKKADPVVERKARSSRRTNSNGRIRNALCKLRFFRHKDNLKTAKEACIRWNASFKNYNLSKKINLLPACGDDASSDIKVEKTDQFELTENKDLPKIDFKSSDDLFNIQDIVNNKQSSVTFSNDYIDVDVKTPKSETDNVKFANIESPLPQADENTLNKTEYTDNAYPNSAGETSSIKVTTDESSNQPKISEIYADPISLDSIKSFDNKEDAFQALCDLCYKQFACNVSLMAHRKIDHYMCSFCGDAFLYDGELGDHELDCGLFDLDTKSESMACMVQLVMQDLT